MVDGRCPHRPLIIRMPSPPDTPPRPDDRAPPPLRASNAPAAAPIPPWLPNAISSARVVLVPVWILLAEHVRALQMREGPTTDLWLPAILLVLGVSDILDGILARRFGLTSRTGEILDAAADKLAQMAFVTYLALRGPPVWASIPVAFAVLVIGRDVLLAIGYWTLRVRRKTVDTTHRVHGKVSSVLLFFVVLAAVSDVPVAVTWALVLASTAAIIGSTGAYTAQGLRALQSDEAPAPGRSNGGRPK